MLYIIISLIVIILLIISIIISNNIVNIIFIKGDKPVLPVFKRAVEETEEDKLKKKKRKEWFESSQKDVYVTTEDNLKLHAHLIENNNSDTFVIIAHGYEGKGAYMRYFGEKIYDMGYSILLIDLRSHGKSEGKIYSFGYYEKIDILSWCNYINLNYTNKKIVLFGVSMGATAMMMCMGDNRLPNNVKVLIDDCGFTEGYEQIGHRVKLLHKLPFFPFIPIMSIITKIRLGFSFGDANALKHLKKSNIPCLFIHGDKDWLVPFTMLDKLYNACSSNIKEKLVIKDANHIEAALQDEELYWGKVKNFIENNINL
ncbi:alpha/beta hydrolase [Brachyspira intermedia]|uniref:alpha/beta hydrolase n=1 Tax=Brachyspira intermedia TaxID=84377 RepID=UPI003005EF16